MLYPIIFVISRKRTFFTVKINNIMLFFMIKYYINSQEDKLPPSNTFNGGNPIKR